MASILQGGKGGATMPVHEPAADEHMPQGGGDGGEAHSHLVSHGDGTHHIEHEDGTQTDHPHIGHALMHLAGKHSEGMHHHTHSDGLGGGHTTHTSEHGGEPEGPHEHPDAEGAAEHLKQFFGEEAQEPEHQAHGKAESSEGKDYD